MRFIVIYLPPRRRTYQSSEVCSVRCFGSSLVSRAAATQEPAMCPTIPPTHALARPTNQPNTTSHPPPSGPRLKFDQGARPDSKKNPPKNPTRIPTMVPRQRTGSRSLIDHPEEI